MSVRISLEIGHEAVIRAKRTPEGFTHDWKVFVSGGEHAQIHYYVEKVVFHLHETFQKPKRTVKEPPYVLKESGYAGFTLPIEIYLRNKDEPKKISFNYDLNLQTNGPPIVKTQKEKYVFNMPNDEFKTRLLKGGGIIVNTGGGQQDLIRDTTNRSLLEEKSQLLSKPKLSGSDFIRKHKPKPEDLRYSNSFQELFGTPITKTSLVPVDSKSIPKDKSTIINNKSGTNEKEKVKSKHGTNKEKDKEKEKFKEKGADLEIKIKEKRKKEDKKDYNKEREKKERRDKSPKCRSPSPMKRPPSPKRLSSPIAKYKDEKKLELSKDKRIIEDKGKLERKLKKEKRDRERDKNKESKHKDKEGERLFEQKENKTVVNNESKEKHKVSPTLMKNVKKDYSIKERDYIKENGKVKSVKSEEKPKHKHKKKDKERKEKDKNNDKEKPHKKLEKPNGSATSKYIETTEDGSTQKENDKSLFSSPKTNAVTEAKSSERPKKPLNTLFAECGDSDTSITSTSSNENLFNEPPIKSEPKKLLELSPRSEKQKVKHEKIKNKEKKTEKKEHEKKRKHKSNASNADDPLEKIAKVDPLNVNSKNLENDQAVKQTELPLNFVEYRNLLKDLRQKILAIKNNSDLQKVAEIIASSGRFHVSAHTIDFDLTLLETSTVTRLENYLSSL